MELEPFSGPLPHAILAACSANDLIDICDLRAALGSLAEWEKAVCLTEVSNGPHTCKVTSGSQQPLEGLVAGEWNAVDEHVLHIPAL